MTGDNSMQADFWNAAPGQKWLAHEAALDAAMDSILDRLLELADLQPGERVLDIGCGTGLGTARASALVGAAGHVTGLDIAEQLLNRARARNADNSHDNATFLLADAETHALGTQPFDAIISRFGVMFFSDTVAAFRNMGQALRPKGRMLFAAWGPMPDNPWFSISRDVAVAHLGAPTPVNPNAPGPMAFQDADQVTTMMREAGLVQVNVRTQTVLMNPKGQPRRCRTASLSRRTSRADHAGTCQQRL